LDSPELIRVRLRPAPESEPVLAPWTVPVVTFSAAEALDLLGHPLRGVRAGQSWSHSQRIASFASDLAERGRVLPLLEFVRPASVDDAVQPGPPATFRARWAPVLQGPDLLTFQSLVAAMPPVGRAQVAAPSDTRGQSPSALVQAALEELTDAAVRARLRDRGLNLVGALPRRGRRPRVEPPTEAWLAALTSPDGLFQAKTEEVERIAQSIAPWDEVLETTTGPARLLLRVVEPRLPDRDRDGLDSSWDEDLDDDYSDEWDDSSGDQRADPKNQFDGQLASSATSTSAGDSKEAAAAGGGDDDDQTTASEPAPWRVEFLLQSAEDPSLQLPAAAVWEGQQALARWLDRPDELLLTELGRASTICPALVGALHQARPEAMELDGEGLIGFLSESAPLLEQAGFEVLVPSWWTKRPKLGLSAWVKSPDESSGAFGKESLCQFNWRLAVGEEPLTEEELAMLAAAKEPLVRLRGRWLAFDPDRLARALAFVQANGAQERSVADVIALAATHPDDLDLPLEVTGVAGEGTLGALLAGSADLALESVAPPTWFSGQLRPYQERGLAWLSFLSRLTLGACLADDMGLGKTVQLLALEAAERDQDMAMRAGRTASGKGGAGQGGAVAAAATASGEDGTVEAVKPTLILCPMSLVGNWQREAARFAPKLRVYAHHGGDRLRPEALAAGLAGVDLVLTTYQTALRDADHLAEIAWRRVVLDEAQAIKNPESKAAKTVRRLTGDARVALTGTPVENRLSELRSIMDFCNPGLLGSPERFRSRYAHPIERYSDLAAANHLKAVTRPYILRRVKTDRSIIDDLPEKIELREPCNLTAEQASLYQAVVNEMLEAIDEATGIKRSGLVLAALTKLKQICNHPAQFLHQGSRAARRSGKVTRLLEILDEILAEGDKALLFTQYTEFGGLLMEEITTRFGTEPLFLHGQVARARREEMVARFQSDNGPPLFILSLKAGGTGLNLTAANHVIHVDRWWNPAVENLATDRAFRIGQKRGVQVRKFVTEGTLEERIDKLIEEKKALADMVVGTGEAWLTEMSTAELRDLFALSERAVEEEVVAR
jgi:superfamily II DNA or RNA helicase